MRHLDKDGLEKALRHLNDVMEYDGAAPAEMIVCGGSSLIFTGLASRATADVDVVALLRGTPSGGREVDASKPLPDGLKKAAAVVGESLRLDRNWLNPDSWSITLDGLPEGIMDRLHTVRYGNALTVHYIGRYDQIHFKLYAASFPDDKHLQDLINLSPAESEIEAAARWAMRHWPPDSPKREICKNIVRELGYAESAERL
jgi:hypothetical protein